MTMPVGKASALYFILCLLMCRLSRSRSLKTEPCAMQCDGKTGSHTAVIASPASLYVSRI